MSSVIYITREELVRHTPLNGNIDMDKIIHFAKIAQDIHIQGYLGTKLFDKINEDMVAGTLTQVYRDLVDKYIKPIVIHLTFLEYLPFSQYTISNNGVFKKKSENGELPSIAEMDKMEAQAKDTADHYVTRFMQHMRHNAHNLYPEYLTTDLEDMKPQKDISFGNWQI